MKKGTKILALFVLSIVLASLLVGVVSAVTMLDNLKSILSTLLSGDSSNVQGYIAKILLIVLVALLVYAISAALPFVPDNDTIRWAVSIIIAVLSFLFVSIDNIKYILVNYEALGIALTTFIPWIIIVVFTSEFKQKDKTGMAGPISKLIIILFAVYIGFRWLTIDTKTTPEMAWAYPITLALTLIWLFIEGPLSRWVKKEKLKSQVEKSEETINEAAAGAAILASVPQAMAESKIKFSKKYY